MEGIEYIDFSKNPDFPSEEEFEKYLEGSQSAEFKGNHKLYCPLARFLQDHSIFKRYPVIYMGCSFAWYKERDGEKTIPIPLPLWAERFSEAASEYCANSQDAIITGEQALSLLRDCRKLDQQIKEQWIENWKEPKL